MKRLLAALCLSIAAASAPISAWALGPDTAAATAPAGEEAAAERIVTEAYTAFQAGLYPALSSRVDALRGVLDRAPPGSRANAYPLAALMLGSYAVENRRYADAIVVLDRGLGFQPDAPGLLLERGNAYLALQRPRDALGSFEAALSSSRLTDTPLRARLLRSRGVALIDLSRLDEAEASLNASLQLAPNEASTRGELEYIAGLRAGRPAAPAEVPQNQQRPPAPGERTT